MEQVLINQKSLRERKNIKQIQKASFRKYGRGKKSILKNRMGKMVAVAEPTIRSRTEGVFVPEIPQEELLRILRESQLTGMSGNNFPVVQKLESFLRSKKEKRMLIVNGVECEPGLLHDEWLLEHCFDEIRAGIQLICRTLKIRNSVLAVKTSSVPEARGIHVCCVPARYPMGEEHILIRQLLGIQMEKEQHPAEEGFLVINVQTVYQIYHLCQKTYQDGRYVTLANLDTGEAKVAFVKNGEGIRNTLERIFQNQKNRKCFAGGGILSAHPIDGEECFSGNVSFAAIGEPANVSNDNPCRKCGKCSRKCPMGVDVKEIVRRREHNQNADITGLGLEKCIHCNSCTYFCSAGKNIASLLE